MAAYIQDPNLPSHGKRAKVDNAGTIRIHISRADGCIFLEEPESFELYLNIDTKQNTYHATVEAERGLSRKKQVTSVEVTTDVLEELVLMAQNKDFMALNNDVIFPNMAMLDGNVVSITVKTDVGNVSLDSNMLEDTLWNGFIPVGDFGIQTPLDKLAAIAFNLLGIELEEDSDEEEDEQ